MRVLVSAYACEPDRGSEPGVGWNWTQRIARDGDVWVITRRNNREAIERALSSGESPAISFSYVDLPRWIRWIKRGNRGVHLYYYLWQVAAYRRARELHERHNFDLVQHLTFANAYAPALAGFIDATFVWGPVGGGVRAPWRLWREWGGRGLIFEVARSIRRLVGRVDPLVRATWKRADVILTQNPDTIDWLPAAYRDKAIVAPNAGFSSKGLAREGIRDPSQLRGLFPARLLHWKGTSLAIRAIHQVDDEAVTLDIVGEGPDEVRLRALVRELRVEGRVRFHGWLPQSELFQLMAISDVLLFPSLHEDCGFVVVEAMAHGVIPIVLDRGGPPGLVGDAGIKIELQARDQIVRQIAENLKTLKLDLTAREQLRAKARRRAMRFEWAELPYFTAPKIKREEVRRT